MTTDRLRIDVEDGKYTIVQPDKGTMYVLRYGDAWLEGMKGSNMVLSMAYELEELRAKTNLKAAFEAGWEATTHHLDGVANYADEDNKRHLEHAWTSYNFVWNNVPQTPRPQDRPDEMVGTTKLELPMLLLSQRLGGRVVPFLVNIGHIVCVMPCTKTDLETREYLPDGCYISLSTSGHADGTAEHVLEDFDYILRVMQGRA